MPVLPPLLARMFKCTNTLTWLRNRPSTISHATTYNTSTWPRHSECTPIVTTTTPVRSLRPNRKLSSVTKFHRLYDVGNLLGTPPPPPPPGKATLLPRLLVDGDDEDEGWSCTEMENQSDPEELRNIRISKGWHRSRAGTFAPPGSPRG